MGWDYGKVSGSSLNGKKREKEKEKYLPIKKRQGMMLVHFFSSFSTYTFYFQSLRFLFQHALVILNVVHLFLLSSFVGTSSITRE